MDYDLIQVSELNAVETPSNTDVLPIQNGTELKKITFQNLKNAATGDKLNKPTGGNGTSGQMLLTNGDGSTQWASPDTTLATTGKAADAKATGDAIKAVDANLAAPYSTSATYAVGDYCTKDGVLKRCNTPITTAEAWNSAHWDDAKLGGDVSDLRSALSKYDDLARIIKITSTTTTLGDIATTLNQVNTVGDHVFFDMSALGVMMYLCTIFIDTANNVYKVFDLVSGRYAEGTYDATMLLTMATAQANGLAVQSQIDYLQNEIDELGGKSVLANPDALAELIASGASTGTISSGDKVSFNWMASVLGTTTSGLTVTCSDIGKFADEMGEAEAKTYLFVYDGTNWTYDGTTVTLSDYGIAVTGTPATGEVMTIVTTVTPKSFDFVDYDGTGITPDDTSVEHYWVLEQTYAPDTKVFDTYESLFCIQSNKTIAAGSYYLPMYSYRSGKTFNVCFTLDTAYGGSDKVQFRSGGYTYAAADDATGTSISGVYYPKNITPIAFGSATALGAVIPITIMSTEDAVAGGYTDMSTAYVEGTDYTVGNFDTCALGNNTWIWSDLCQHLNDDTKDDNYIPTHDNDIASAYNRGIGWLYGLDPRVKKHIQLAKYKMTAGYGAIGVYERNTTYDVVSKVFLLSMKEMSFDLNTAEGEITELYGEYTNNTLINTAVAERAKYNKAGGTLNSYRWARSAFSSGAFYARLVTSTGANNGGSSAYSAYYFAPAFIFGKSVNQ